MRLPSAPYEAHVPKTPIQTVVSVFDYIEYIPGYV